MCAFRWVLSSSLEPVAHALMQHFQTRFALSSAQVFNRSDINTDSERFYNSVRDFLLDPHESSKVKKLLQWWNRYAISRPGRTQQLTYFADEFSLRISRRRTRRTQMRIWHSRHSDDATVTLLLTRMVQTRRKMRLIRTFLTIDRNPATKVI